MPVLKPSAFSFHSSAKNSFVKIIQKFLSTNYQLLTTNTQGGFGQLAIIALLVAGVAVTTLVIQNRTNISPNAAENVEPGFCQSGYTFKGGDAGDDANWEYTGCGGSEENGDSCQYDEKYEEYECKNGYRCFNDYYKSEATSCKWESKDPHYHCDKDDRCGGDVQENSDKSEDDCKKAGGTWKDNRCFTPSSNTGGGTNAPGTQGTSGGNTQYDQGDCRDGAQSYRDGYAWIAYCGQVCQQNSDCSKNTSDGAVNPETSNWCYGFNGGQAPRCMKLVQTDNKEVNDQTRKSNNTKAVEAIKSTIAQGGNPNPGASEEAKQSSSAELRAKVNAQNTQRGELVGELATILNMGGSTNSTLTAEIQRAQTLITTASSTATACYTGNDKPLSDSCDAQAQAANDIAVAASRVALFDAVAAGIPNTCVKVDMAVGSNTSNSLIEVTPKDGTAVSRLFMCRGAESYTGAKDGDIKWRVRDDKGALQEVSQESLNKLGITNNQKNISSVPQDFINRRNNAATLASQPAYNATGASNTSSDWKEVAVSNCLNSCSSFPSGATCYQKGSLNLYNCDGQKPTTSTSTNPQTNTTKKNLPKGATCGGNSECKSGQCNPGTSKCL